MSRGAGRHQPPRAPEVPEVDPNSAEGQGLGMSDRMQGYPSPIPGGQNHVTNAPTVRRNVPVADSKPEIKAIDAHGVPPGTHTSRERAEAERGPNSSHMVRPPRGQEPGTPTPAPVPVFIVSDQDSTDTWTSASPHHITVPATGQEPARVCGRNSKRVEILLLNESTSSNIRIGQRPADVSNPAGGALLPWPANSYLKLKTQDELYAISVDSGTPLLSIIEVFDTEGTD